MSKQKHTVELVKTELEIDEDIKLHEKGWRFQRVGWWLILALVILAALGAFGDGILSKETLSFNNTKLDYQRFHRQEARMDLKVELNNPDTVFTISFPNQYLKNFKVESILPEPTETKIANDQVNYYFNGQGQANVAFYLVPQKPGNINGSIRVNENQFALSHFIYP